MKSLLLAAILGVFGVATDLRADYLLSGSKNGLSASANFSVSGGMLIITVTNTSAAAATSGKQVLSGFYFSTSGANPGFTSETAANPTGTVKINGSGTVTTLSSSTNAASLWGFDGGEAGSPYSMPYGFISTALSNCSNCTLDATHGLSTSSIRGGLVSTNSGVSGTTVYDNSVIFTLKLPSQTTFTTANISNAVFQFGDAGLGETDFMVLPEPVSYSGAIALLLIPIVWSKRRRPGKSEDQA